MEGWSGYEGLADAHYGRLRRLCALLLGDREEANEVVQEVFLKAWTLRNGAGAPNDWGAWLTRVAVNGCRDRRRVGWWPRFRRSDRVEDLPTAQVAATLGVSEGSVKRHLFRAIHRLRQTLGGRR